MAPAPTFTSVMKALTTATATPPAATRPDRSAAPVTRATRATASTVAKYTSVMTTQITATATPLAATRMDRSAALVMPASPATE